MFFFNVFIIYFGNKLKNEKIIKKIVKILFIYLFISDSPWSSSG